MTTTRTPPEDVARRRATFRPMAWLAVSMLCGVISTGGPLLTDGGLEPLRAILVAIFATIFVFAVVTAWRNRPPR